jgi:hypothetical protein
MAGPDGDDCEMKAREKKMMVRPLVVRTCRPRPRVWLCAVDANFNIAGTLSLCELV